MPKKSTKAKEQRFKVGDRVIVVDPDSDACGLSGVIQEFNSEDPGECCVRFKNPREIFHDGELGSLSALEAENAELKAYARELEDRLDRVEKQRSEENAAHNRLHEANPWKAKAEHAEKLVNKLKEMISDMPTMRDDCPETGSDMVENVKFDIRQNIEGYLASYERERNGGE